MAPLEAEASDPQSAGLKNPLINHLPGLNRFSLEHCLAELSIGGRRLRDAVAQVPPQDDVISFGKTAG